MKKTIILTLAIALTTLFSTATFGQTTLEEYNYVTKGYKVQLESGLDMKKGYELENVDEATAGERTVTLKKLIKVSANQKKTVAYMLTYKKGSGATQYICIPHPSSDNEILDLYWEALYNGEGDWSFRLQLMAYVLSRSLIW
ncbi:MAG TPA: hypothetical protein P5312_08565 [Bacteroidales bacterium]|nr:hypothetical protein [Bacteroidales bacterium]HRT00083.1 hypothetical protein [Bacteroidales bacterium]